MKKILLAALLSISAGAFAQTTISCDSIFQTSTCAGGNVIITFQTTGNFPWGNVFTAQLSDNWGNWTAPMVMGSTPFVIGGNGIIFGTIPSSANFGFLYRVRIVSSNPADTSNDSPNTLLVTQVAQLNQVVSNPGDSACPGDTITLFALNFASSYLWSTGDTTASINVTTSGVYSVTTTDALTCESTAQDTVVFDASLCTGIAENEVSALQIYPNPASGEFTVYQPGGFSVNSIVEISDVTGKIIMTQQIQSGATEQHVSLDGIAAGIYMVLLHSNGESIAYKLIIQQ
jgi:hypothetical protein